MFENMESKQSGNNEGASGTENRDFKEIQEKTQEIARKVLADAIYKVELEAFERGIKPERMSEEEIGKLLAGLEKDSASH